MSPLSPANMYRGPTPFNTPAVGAGAGGAPLPQRYPGVRARQHPPPHAHPQRSTPSSSSSSNNNNNSGLYTSMRSPSSPARSSPTSGSVSGGSGSASVSNEKNQIDLERIAAGLDTRTTVMIKNIPNKMNDRDLVAFIDRVCPRRIDFLYLRMDFKNGAWSYVCVGECVLMAGVDVGCNVGYAFVNFITVQDLLLFAKTQLGVKWYVGCWMWVDWTGR